MPKIRFHDLKHTYATLLLTNNYGAKAVSELLGHSNTIITTSTYFEKNKIVVDCIEKLNSYIKRVEPKATMQDIDEIIPGNLDTNLIMKDILKIRNNIATNEEQFSVSLFSL